MSLVLETLDQLLCSDMPLSVIRGLYPDDGTFAVAIHSLLRNGDIRLFSDGSEVPEWRWRELFKAGGFLQEMPWLRLEITDKGARFVTGTT